MKIALITGASSGIGKELAKNLAEHKICVIAVARNAESLNKLQRSYPNYIIPLVADLSIKEGRRKVFDYLKPFPKIDYIINNAAIIIPVGDLDKITPEEIEQNFQTNIIAPLILISALKNKLLPDSRVLNITSKPGEGLYNGMVTYCIAKSALDKLTDILKYHKILTASVYPGNVDTNMLKVLADQDISKFARAEEFRKKRANNESLPAALSANFLSYLLLSISDTQFIAEKHNIYDQKHHQYWLGDNKSLISKIGFSQKIIDERKEAIPNLKLMSKL
ncbi:Short-chain dehydrogenase/reductase SDR [Rickettsiales bacterium Ac37b]|nr:Short-chain dehydrogenase/reductase SDR [Rickettsiales bacterium Ac37b]